MRPGTPGFQGKRLREARDVRGISAISLSEVAEVSAQAISQYEHGRSTPGPDVLDRMANALNVPREFFILPARAANDDTVFFRSMSSATKGARARGKGRLGWLEDIFDYLRDVIQFPEANFPDLELPSNPLLLSDDEIEQAAEDLRKFWQLPRGPVSDMVLLVESQGGVIGRDRLGAETLDGLSTRRAFDQRPFILVGIDKGSSVRWRFDVAHELGHLVLHPNVDSSNLRRGAIYKKIEQQAHRFASAFLLPMDEFSEELFILNLDSLRVMKSRWNTSIAMMIIRARHAGLVTEEAERRLWINLSRRGWKRAEPYDDTMPAEVPRSLRRAFELVLGDGLRTAKDVVSQLGLPAGDIEVLAGLPQSFFSNYAPVTVIRPSSQVDDDPSATPADVVRFPVRDR